MSGDERSDDDPRVAGRATLLPEEQQAGSADPEAQARAILRDSDQRTLDRNAAPGTHLERRRSEDTVDPPAAAPEPPGR